MTTERLWYEKNHRPTTTITDAVRNDITYVFRHDDGDVQKIDARNYRDGRTKLNKITANRKGYRLQERIV